MLIFFHILVLQEYWVLTESRIPLKPVLGGVIIVALPLVHMNRLNKTESDVSLYCKFFLLLKDPFFHIIYSSHLVDCHVKVAIITHSKVSKDAKIRNRYNKVVF